MRRISFIDLHMHSNYSDDGEYTPSQLVELCYDAGVKVLAIADHNSVKGIKEAQMRAKELGLQLITACEFDCVYQGINLHVLGYGIDADNLIFEEIENNIISQEQNNSLKKLELTNRLGFELSKEQLDAVAKQGIYTGEMFAEVLLKDQRYLKHELLKPYRLGGSRSDNPYVNFYWDYYAQGKPCFTEIKYPSLENVIQIINLSGGISVLAHPGNNLKGKFELLDEMVKIGIQGIEAFSNYHTEEENFYFYKKAREYGLIYTCGSDFHGKIKPQINIGETGCLVDEYDILEELVKKRLLEPNILEIK